MANWLQSAGKTLLGQAYQPISKMVGLTTKPFQQKVPTTTKLDMNALRSVAQSKNNTKDVKASTTSSPTYNPSANILPQGISQRKEPDWQQISQGLQNINLNLANLQQPKNITEVGNADIPTTELPSIQKPPETEADKYMKQYLETMQPTSEEEQLQEQLRQLTSGASLGVEGLEGQGRGIPLSLVRGQQEKLLRQASLRTQPLQSRLEQLQAERLARAEMAKEASEYYQPQEDEAMKPMTVGAGSTLVDPTTGKVIYQGAEEEDFSGFKSVQGGLYDVKSGKWVVEPKEETTGTGLSGMPSSYKEWSLAGGEAGTGKSFADWISKSGENAYGAKITETALTTIDELLPQVGITTVGPVGSVAKNIPGTPAYNFKSALDTLKSNIAFGALTEMRAASKTGGALGQVSDREGQLLQSSLGALDQGQSPKAFREQLDKIEESLRRWSSAVNTLNMQKESQPRYMELEDGTMLTLQADGTYK